jgi:hypothetical protein
LSEARRRRIHLTGRQMSEVTALYSKVLAGEKGPRAAPNMGWLLIPYVSPTNDSQPSAEAIRLGNDYYDDCCCTVCNGHGRVPCHNCNSAGDVDSMRTESQSILTGAGGIATLPNSVPTRVQCPVCGGRGFLPCNSCSARGIDPDLSRAGVDKRFEH